MERTIELFHNVEKMCYQYNKDLVSIVTPCYNTGSILHRLFDSVLSQDYPFVEMYAINDGSSDDTEERIKEYIPKFEDKGYKLECINQPNGGQSSALNTGLKLVQGEFFIWPDSDDFFSSPQSISVFVNKLKSREDVSVVRCLPTYIDEKTMQPTRVEPWNDTYFITDQFENCLFGESFFWGAGDYMIRMEAFDMANPSRDIYVEKGAGQNWQILLPVLCGNKCLTISDSVFCILERSSSHSRVSVESYEKKSSQYSCYDRTLISTLNNIVSIEPTKKDRYLSELNRRNNIRDFELAVRYKERSEALNLYKRIRGASETINNKRLLLKFYFLFLLGWLKY